jgi:hypothetical protein
VETPEGKTYLEQVALLPERIGPHPGRIVAVTVEEGPSYHVVASPFLAFWMKPKAFHFPN